jgi:hypothetical protein
MRSSTDPDGNGWLLQEVKARPPGREGENSTDIASLADLLHETSIHHGEFEAVAPPHNWWDWYAAYANARQDGSPRETLRSPLDAIWPRSNTSSSRRRDPRAQVGVTTRSQRASTSEIGTRTVSSR